MVTTESLEWSEGSVLMRVEGGPAIIGTDDERTLAAVERDTPWYGIRSIERRKLVHHVEEFWISRFPVTCWQYANYLNEIGAELEDGMAHLGGVVLAADVSVWLRAREISGSRHGVGIVHRAPWQPSPSCAELPVTLVTWFGASEYARHCGAALPSELQWEKAARGPDGLAYPWGNEYETGRANLSDVWAQVAIDSQEQWDRVFCQSNSGPAWLASRPNKCGDYSGGVSPYGCEDMIGNVAEWCEDTYDATHEGGRADFRAMRGAGRYGYPAISRAATRRRRAPESFGENLGFRIVSERRG
jgi:formylglycine-generating enzyme required for sulfatase activity